MMRFILAFGELFFSPFMLALYAVAPAKANS
jgi:hypothetical protein